MHGMVIHVRHHEKELVRSLLIHLLFNCNHQIPNIHVVKPENGQWNEFHVLKNANWADINLFQNERITWVKDNVVRIKTMFDKDTQCLIIRLGVHVTCYFLGCSEAGNLPHHAFAVDTIFFSKYSKIEADWWQEFFILSQHNPVSLDWR